MAIASPPVAVSDSTSLASLTAGNMVATSGLAELIGEGFPNVFHEGQRKHAPSPVSDRAILVVVFDRRMSLGLVRLRVKKMTDAMGQVFDIVTRRGADAQGKNPLAEMTDDDLDNRRRRLSERTGNLMSFINYSSVEIYCKASTMARPPARRLTSSIRMITLRPKLGQRSSGDETERTLFFDFLFRLWDTTGDLRSDFSSIRRPASILRRESKVNS